MAIRTIESRFERMSVNDENEPSGPIYTKPKVITVHGSWLSFVDIPGGISFNSAATIRTWSDNSAYLEPQSLKPSEICATKQQ